MLTDNNGRQASFRNCVLIMTTNSGALEMARESMGFQKQDNSSDGSEVIKKTFSPEFRNRLTSIVQFGALSVDVIHTVVDKFLTELQAQLDEKRVVLEVMEKLELGWRIMAMTKKWVQGQCKDLFKMRSNKSWLNLFCLVSLLKKVE